MDGWMDGLKDGWMDGWMDGQNSSMQLKFWVHILI